MARKKRLPKKAKQTEELTGDEVMEAIFGKRAKESLKQQALTNDDSPKNDYRLPENQSN